MGVSSQDLNFQTPMWCKLCVSCMSDRHVTGIFTTAATAARATCDGTHMGTAACMHSKAHAGGSTLSKAHTFQGALHG